MHFFFDRISPETYAFEYDLPVTHTGDFSNGITTAIRIYAPGVQYAFCKRTGANQRELNQHEIVKHF